MSRYRPLLLGGADPERRRHSGGGGDDDDDDDGSDGGSSDGSGDGADGGAAGGGSGGGEGGGEEGAQADAAAAARGPALLLLALSGLGAGDGCEGTEPTPPPPGETPSRRRPAAGDADDAAAADPPAAVAGLLLASYERYAALYPNPNLAAEAAERDDIVRAAAAALEAEARARQTQIHQQEQDPIEGGEGPGDGAGRGWWRRLLPRLGGAAAGKRSRRGHGNELATPGERDIEGMLEYYYEDESDGDESDGGEPSPLGTGRDLDPACVPEEAALWARHLWACRARAGCAASGAVSAGAGAVSPAAAPPEGAGAAVGIGSSASVVSVVGLGRVAELSLPADDPAGEAGDGGGLGGAPRARRESQLTSDRDGLVAYHEASRRRREEQSLPDEGWHPGMARAAYADRCGLLAVNWGLPGDPTVVLYRKTTREEAGAPAPASASHKKSRSSSPGAAAAVWQAVAALSPSQAVRSNLPEAFLDEPGEQGGPAGASRLLAVTGLVPLVVEASASSSSTSAVVLAVSRLGGTIELVPVPDKYVAEVTDGGPGPGKGPRKRALGGGGRNRHQHYAGNLPDLSDRPDVSSRAVALTAGERHADATCLEALALPAAAPTERHQQQHQHRHHFLLAAAGTASRGGRGEAVTFWSVAVLADGSSPGGSVRVRAALLDAVGVGAAGPDATVFASPAVRRHWRRPRRVRLRHRRGDRAAPSPAPASSADGSPPEPAMTISTPAPVTSLRFHAGTGRHGALLAAVLDANGGLQVLDCSRLLLHLSGDPAAAPPPPPLVAVLESRAELSRRASSQLVKQGLARDASSSSSSFAPPRIVDGCWCSRRLNPDETGPALLAVAVSGHPAHLVLLPVPPCTDGPSSPPLLAAMPLPRRFSPSGLRAIRDGRALVLGRSDGPDEYAALVLDRLDPRSLVQSLVLQSKYRDAIDTARNLPSSEQAAVADAVEAAKLGEWRRTLDVQWLEAIQDGGVVVDEALSLDAERIESVIETDEALALCRQVHAVALQRAGEDSSSAELRQRLIRLGTYELLCQNLLVQPSLLQFCESFLPVEIVEIAVSLARSQDLAGLSILRFRHWDEFSSSFDDILNVVPLSVEPYYYHHLLPTCAPGTFVRCQGEEPVVSGLAEYPAHVLYQFDTDTILDDFDCRLVLDASEPTTVDVESVQIWYDHRLREIQSFSQSVDDSIAFAACALVAMNNGNAGGSKSLQWQRALRRSRATRKVLLELAQSDQVDGVYWSLDLDSLHGVGLPDLIQKLFQVPDAMSLKALYLDVFLPLLESLSPIPGPDDVDMQLSAFCRRLMDEASQDSFPKALRTCSLICTFSRGSVALHKRWIKSRRCLDETARWILSSALAKVQASPLDPIALRAVLDDCWSLYEALPMFNPLSVDASGAEYRDADDRMHDQLVLMDILSSWRGSSVLPIHATSEAQAQEIFSIITKAMSSQLSRYAVNFSESDATMLLTLISSDISALKGLRCFDGVDLGSIATRSLVSALVKSTRIEVLNVLLSTPAFDWLHTQVVVEELLSFVSDVVDSNWADSGAVSAAAACRELVGRFYPDALQSVRSSWRYLEAADFVQSVLFRGKSAKITPDVLRKQSPLDAVDMLLSENPELILCDCGEWADPGYADAANKSRRKARRRAVSPDPENLVEESKQSTIMPGEAILHLSKLLGIDNESARHAVLCLTVSYGLSSRLYGACANVCFRLLDNASVTADAKLVAATVETVASVVSIDEYTDVETKRELCICCLIWATETRQPTFLPTVKLVEFVGGTEYRRFLALDEKSLPASHHLHLVERVCCDTAIAFPGTRLAFLFETLQIQASGGSLDGSLLIALSKFAFFWAISQCTTPKAYIVTGIEESFFREIASLSSSLLLHAPDAHLSSASLEELQALLERQIVASGVTYQSEPITDEPPRPDLVRRLQDRGYSEFGARRALAMTGSKSFEVALRWAVLHCLDHDFDQPIVILKPHAPRFIDICGISYLKQLFALSGYLVSDLGRQQRQKAGTAAPALPGANDGRGSDRPRRHSTSDGPRHDDCHVVGMKSSGQPVEAVPPEYLDSDAALQQDASKRTAKSALSRPDLHEGTEPTAALLDSSSPAVHGGSNGAPCPPSTPASPDRDIPKGKSPSTVTTRKSHIPPPKVDVSHVGKASNSSSRPSIGSAAESRRLTRSIAAGLTAHGTSVNLSPSSRSSLVLRGQAALRGARKAASPDSDERRRLIEAGRKLLISARSSRVAIPSTSQDSRLPSSSEGPGAPASHPPVASASTKAAPVLAPQPGTSSGASGRTASDHARSPAEDARSQRWDLEDVETSGRNIDAVKLPSPPLQEAQPGGPAISSDWDFDDDFDLT